MNFILVNGRTPRPHGRLARNSIRRSSGRPALRATIPFCTSMPQRTASTTLWNSIRMPSPARFHHAPVMYGDGWIDQIAAQRQCVRSSCVPVSRLKPLFLFRGGTRSWLREFV